MVAATQGKNTQASALDSSISKTIWNPKFFPVTLKKICPADVLMCKV